MEASNGNIFVHQSLDMYKRICFVAPGRRQPCYRQKFSLAARYHARQATKIRKASWFLEIFRPTLSVRLLARRVQSYRKVPVSPFLTSESYLRSRPYEVPSCRVVLMCIRDTVCQ